jgi:hypothetical protein
MGRRFGLRRLLLPDLGPILGLALGLGPGGASRPPLAIVAASVVAPFDSAICIQRERGGGEAARKKKLC